MRCGAQDSFEHLTQCCELEGLPKAETADSLLGHLILLTNEAMKGALMLPVRSPMPEIDEISLTAMTDGESNPALSPRSSLDHLSFEVSGEEDSDGWLNE